MVAIVVVEAQKVVELLRAGDLPGALPCLRALQVVIERGRPVRVLGAERHAIEAERAVRKEPPDAVGHDRTADVEADVEQLRHRVAAGKPEPLQRGIVEVLRLEIVVGEKAAERSLQAVAALLGDHVDEYAADRLLRRNRGRREVDLLEHPWS